MTKPAKKVREPLFHVAKRNSMEWWKAWLIRFAAIIAALIVNAFIIVLLTKQNPIEVYSSMIKGNFGTERKIWMMLQKTARLLCIAVAVTPAFKMKFWNLGAEGQVLMGALCSMIFMFNYGDKMSGNMLTLVMFASAVIGGIVWGVIPALFKAKWNTNESLFTLMMNYIAIQFVSFAIAKWVPNGSGKMGKVNSATHAGWMPSIFGKKFLLIIILVLIVTVLMYIYLKYSKHGYEISVVGESQNTARYIGINVNKVIIRTMILSGALCGFTGFLLVSGVDQSISEELAGGDGFTAIMVSWLAKFNPILMCVTSLLLVFLQRGASEIATMFNINSSVSDIVSGVIIFFIIGCEFFINYQIKLTHSAHKEEKK